MTKETQSNISTEALEVAVKQSKARLAQGVAREATSGLADQQEQAVRSFRIPYFRQGGSLPAETHAAVAELLEETQRVITALQCASGRFIGGSHV